MNQAVQKAGPKGSSGPKPPNEHRFHYTPDPAVPYTGTQTDWGVFPEADDKMPDFQAAAWAVEALSVMDPDAFREEVAIGRAWLARDGEPVAGFDARVSAVLDKVADCWPQMAAPDAEVEVKGWLAAPETLDRAEAADALLQLVACQAANRILDRGGEQDAVRNEVFTESQQKAFDWLMTQHENGIFSAEFGGKTFPDPALTGFGLLALQTKPEARRTAAEQAAIDNGMRWLLENQNDDGTFGQQLPNYTTCIVTAALARWGDEAKKPALDKAQHAILGFQNIEASGYERGDRDYGSIGYGNSQRGDLSNLHFSLEALAATGLDEDHEAFAKALVFLQRTQNLKSVNDFAGKVPDPEREGEMLDATSGDDGGATYYPGNSQAGYLVQPDGKVIPRSYGSMTYALLKAYIFCGMPADDPRVMAAVRWIQSNWDLATNPGADPALGEKVKYQGLFYYYMVLAQALEAVGLRHVEVRVATDGDGGEVVEEIDWRVALREHLEGMQLPDGAWQNGKNGRWMESLPLLCTCYAMVALERCNQ